MKKHFSLEELQQSPDLLKKIQEIVPDSLASLSREEVQGLKVIAETEKQRAGFDRKCQEASLWQKVVNDLSNIEKEMLWGLLYC